MSNIETITIQQKDAVSNENASSSLTFTNLMKGVTPGDLNMNSSLRYETQGLADKNVLPSLSFCVNEGGGATQNHKRPGEPTTAGTLDTTKHEPSFLDPARMPGSSGAVAPELPAPPDGPKPKGPGHPPEATSNEATEMPKDPQAKPADEQPAPKDPKAIEFKPHLNETAEPNPHAKG